MELNSMVPYGDSDLYVRCFLYAINYRLSSDVSILLVNSRDSLPIITRPGSVTVG